MVKFIVGLFGAAWAGFSHPADIIIAGADSSAAAPVYRGWAAAYGANNEIKLNYDPIGSSGGVAKIRDRAVDFGASDVAPPEKDLSKDGLVAVPTVVTAVVPFVNVPKIGDNRLRLTGPLLAHIFLGAISSWSASEVRALNPSLTLPDLPIKDAGAGSPFPGRG